MSMGIPEVALHRPALTAAAIGILGAIASLVVSSGGLGFLSPDTRSSAGASAPSQSVQSPTPSPTSSLPQPTPRPTVTVPIAIPGGPPVNINVTVAQTEKQDDVDWPGWLTSLGTAVTPILVAALTFQFGRKSGQISADQGQNASEPEAPQQH
jgi:hypothetical protein